MVAKRPSEEQLEQETAARLARAQMLLHVRPQGTDVEFDVVPIENLPIAFRRRAAKIAGAPLPELAVDAVHGFAVMWWWTRLYGGEDVTLGEVEAEWDERCKGVRVANIDTEWIGGVNPLGEDDDDEASPEG